MIRKNGEYKVEIREAMRGGDGSVKIEEFWAPEVEMRSKNRMFSRLTLNPGCSIGFHTHDNEDEIFVVIRGRAEADDNGKTVSLEPGDTILTGNGDGHAIRCVGNEPLELVAVISRY
ncbi:MAG: cupin domain-containing protein [Victivallales bacterium]|jgi:mannose-6-phosphate isomerase-like protein (cupin superfamily)|nr:cupin domain-containing protein [Victivallales bacterium]